MNKRSTASPLYLIVILGIALVARLIALQQSFWLDEAAQAIISQNPFEPGHFNGDFQPPLSYILSHVWMQFGAGLGTQAEWFLRIPSVMWAVVTVWALYRLILSLFNTKAAQLSALLLAIAPFHIYYSQEFRMYSMFTALTVLSWLCLREKRYWWMALINGCAIFTHYFAFVTIISQGIYLIAFHRAPLKKVVQNHLISLSPFILWIPTLLQQIHTSSQLIAAWPKWESVSNVGFLRFPGLTLAKFTVGMISPEPRMLYAGAVGIFAIILGSSCLYLLWTAYKDTQARPALGMLAAMSMLPLIMVWIAGLWIAAASPWRIQFALPALYALVAVAYVSASKHLQKGPMAIVTTIFIYLCLQNSYFSYQYLANTQNHREDWRSAIAYTDTFAKDGALILSEYSSPFAPMQWYTHYPYSYTGGSTDMAFSPSSVKEKIGLLLAAHPTIIVYSYLFEISDPEKVLENTLLTYGYSVKEEKDFRGVGIVRTYER